MFRYIHKNKLKYNEGQLAPFFIVILVIIIILALVTINLGKVAFIRTGSTNAVDSGALSAGSMMAGVFNSLASANAEMEKAYWTFFTSVSVSYVIAFWKLAAAQKAAGSALAAATSANATAGTALGQACGSPCSAEVTIKAAAGSLGTAITSTTVAIVAITDFINTTWAILVATSAYYAAQLYYYKLIRKNTHEGRESAVEGGHNYAFTNSGLASKLKEGAPPDEVVDPKQRRNYRDTFDEFLDGIEHSQHYAYDWEDGQARAHNVEVDVSIGDVETYDLKVALLPFAADIALLASSLSNAYSAEASLVAAEAAYGGAEALYLGAAGLLAGACACQRCCGPWNPGCCACWWALCAAAMGTIAGGMALNGTGITANTVAIASMAPIFWLMASALAGLSPVPVVRSHSTSDAWPWIICWIDDIIHDRLVRVDIDQQHEGADLGLWQTRYPDIHSFSLVSFKGTGEIHEPKFEHDASIIDVDKD